MATLTLTGLAKNFASTRVLQGIDLTLADGELLVIVGASGCGKSTLLRLIAGLETPDAGRVVLDGRDITELDPSARDIAMVFQNYALYPHMTVFENMAYSLRVRRLKQAEIRRRVDDAAALLGLSELLGRKPRQLSGGQRQRVAMGRAIVREPKLFLFDEPLSNLDAKLRTQMRAELRRLQRRLGITSLYVTHDQVEAMTLGDRLLVLNQGVAAQLDTPMGVFEHPADTYVAAFIGTPAMNFLPAVVAEGGRAARLETGPLVRFADGGRLGGEGRKLLVGIRPEHLQAGPGELTLAVDLVEPMGSESLVHGHIAGAALAPLIIRLPSGLPVGETLSVRIPPAHLHVFDRASGRRIALETGETGGVRLEAGITGV